MRRGRKSELAALAIEVRGEVGVPTQRRLDPRVIAKLYGFEVTPVSEIGLAPEVLSTLALSLSDRWSGAIISDGHHTLILDNDFHPAARRNASIAHEVSHILLEHPLQSRITYERSCGEGRNLEDEATELAGELLVPGKSLRIAATRGQMSDQDIADQFGVSLAFARWRVNVSGARRIGAGRQTRRR